MWMVDYTDHVNEMNLDKLHGRWRFRRLIPRPPTNGGAPCSVVASSYCSGFYKKVHLSGTCNQFHDHKQENGEHIVSSTRWNPTPEQVMALQEMYQRGVRTPSADEIQLITSKLRQFGKIEGKNVFYWFQNHKARERQKRRRQPDSLLPPLKQANDMEAPQTKGRGLRWSVLEREERLNSGSSSNCVKTLKTSATESRINGRTPLDERENRLQKSSHTTTAKGLGPLQDLSFKPSHLNIISKPSISKAFSLGAQKQSDTTSLNISLLPKGRNNQMLQLFPREDDDPGRPEATTDDEEEVHTTMNLKFTPMQFYEFL